METKDTDEFKQSGRLAGIPRKLPVQGAAALNANQSSRILGADHLELSLSCKYVGNGPSQFMPEVESTLNVDPETLSTGPTQQAEPSPVMEADTPSSHKSHWCVMDEQSTHFFGHFPHATQALLHCWNQYNEIKKNDDTAECGIYLNASSLVEKYTSPKSAWTRQLVEVMGCKVNSNQPSTDENDPHTIYARAPNNKNWGWIKNPDHALQLQQRLPNGEDTSSRVRIAIVNRKSNRKMVNAVGLAQAMMPSSSTKLSWMISVH